MKLSKIMAAMKSDSFNKMILPGLIVIGMLFIAFGNIGGVKSVPVSSEVVAVGDEAEYVEDLQWRLEEMLSKISGAGEVSVMITLAGSGEKVIATDEKITENTTSGGKSVNKDIKTVVSKEQPLVLQEKKPEIEGVAVVASGAGNQAVVLAISKTVTALTGVKTHKVVVLERK